MVNSFKNKKDVTKASNDTYYLRYTLIKPRVFDERIYSDFIVRNHLQGTPIK